MAPLILIIMLTNIYLMSSSAYEVRFMEKRERYCGDDLTRALSLVCRGTYHRSHDKRFDTDFYNIDDYDDEMKISSDELNYPFLQENIVKAMIPIKSRKDSNSKGKGIVFECCYNPCSLKHMELYCGF